MKFPTCGYPVTPILLVCVASSWSVPHPPAAYSQDGILAGGADPAVIAVERDHGQKKYYVFSTGKGVNISYSDDLLHWRRVGRVFENGVPDWARQKVPRSRGLWAPDISFHNGLYHLYYSVSSFGSQRSVIGLAVNNTLDQDDEQYEWIDRGRVIESSPGQCDFNAIDPALFVDDDGQWYLFFGSFWSGLKAVQVDPETGKPRAGAEIVPVASRPEHPTHAIEAPYVIRHGDFYYLFASWDRCCEGAESDYKVVVGRSRKVLGPYLDAKGRSMLEGGGTLILESTERWRGPGHNSVLTTDQGQWLVHHTYDLRRLRAQRVLQIRPITWSNDGWPQVGEPIF